LHFGEAQVPIVASTTAGSYLADLETIDDQLTTYYDVNGDGRMIASDNLLVEVVAGDAFMINFVEESRTNLPLGDINRLEVGEQVTVAATLVDKYYNRIYEIDSQGSSSHADLQLSATVNGSAVINNIAQTADIALKQGYGTFQVTTEVTEQVDITGNTTLPQLPGLAKYAVLSLDFLKPYPAIEQSIVQPVVDSLINPLHFSYSEPVNNIGNELPLRITLEDNPVEGEFTLDGQKITFVPLQPLALARCYEVSSHNSLLRGVAANDEVLAQSISVCAPEARLDIPQRNYTLEGSSYPSAVATAENINISAITSGFVRIAPEGVAASPVAFNWNNPTVA